MAKNYTLEDVETLRGKAGVSYEEAVSLLDKYDGDVTRALIELEKRGQLGAERKSASFRFTMEDVKRLWRKGLNTRIIVERENERLINLSVVFLLLMLILGPYAFVAAVLLMLIFGGKVSLQTEEQTARTVFRAQPVEQPEAAEEPESTPEAEMPEEPEKTEDDFPSITIE